MVKQFIYLMVAAVMLFPADAEARRVYKSKFSKSDCQAYTSQSRGKYAYCFMPNGEVLMTRRGKRWFWTVKKPGESFKDAIKKKVRGSTQWRLKLARDSAMKKGKLREGPDGKKLVSKSATGGSRPEPIKGNDLGVAGNSPNSLKLKKARKDDIRGICKQILDAKVTFDSFNKKYAYGSSGITVKGFDNKCLKDSGIGKSNEKTNVLYRKLLGGAPFKKASAQCAYNYPKKPKLGQKPAPLNPATVNLHKKDVLAFYQKKGGFDQIQKSLEYMKCHMAVGPSKGRTRTATVAK